MVKSELKNKRTERTSGGKEEGGGIRAIPPPPEKQEGGGNGTPSLVGQRWEVVVNIWGMEVCFCYPRLSRLY